MATLYYDPDADLSMIQSKRVAVLGYGSQGHAHALNLRDSRVEVRVGLPENSPSRTKTRLEKLPTMTPAEAAAWADVVMVLLPDTAQAELFQKDLAQHLTPGKTLMFAHGFNIRYGYIHPPPGIDVSMVAPKSPGHRLRELFLEGSGTPALLAVHQDASGKAKSLALSYAKALGLTRAGVLETTFTEETESDLFGEMAVLCGGVSALVKAGFDTLVEAGYQPEIAYFECLHELKLIVDLVYQGGLSYMRHSISDTAEYGDYTGGPRLITQTTRVEMRSMLQEIQSGQYAKAWMEENRQGRPWFRQKRALEQTLLIENIGQQLRRHMPFLSAKTAPAAPLPDPSSAQAKEAL